MTRAQFFAALGLPFLARTKPASQPPLSAPPAVEKIQAPIPRGPHFEKPTFLYYPDGSSWELIESGFPGKWRVWSDYPRDASWFDQPYPIFEQGEWSTTDGKTIWVCVKAGFPGEWEEISRAAHFAVGRRAMTMVFNYVEREKRIESSLTG